MLAVMVLGASGVQMGSRFVASEEASVHAGFKQAVLAAGEGDTFLTMKQLTPVRLLANAFYRSVREAEARGASPEELNALLGRGRAKMGMFDGNLEEGELEIGQVSAQLRDILPAGDIVRQVWRDFQEGLQNPVDFT
jgi:enoyl-[acyl-carrier protein] reductase II